MRQIYNQLSLAATFAVTLLWLSACLSAPSLAPQSAPKGQYVLDPTHASVSWSLSHAGLSSYTARFDAISGTLDFDAAKPARSKLSIIIDPASVHTGLSTFDQTLAYGAKYFDAAQYPQITFVSTAAKQTRETGGLVTGDLTFRGVTKPVDLTVTYNGAGKSYGHPGKTVGFSATGSLLRSDFGLNTLTNFGIGDSVSLRIEVEFNQAFKSSQILPES